MSMFRNNKFKPDAPKIRVERVTTNAAPPLRKPAPSKSLTAAPTNASTSRSSSARPSPKPSSTLRQKSNSPLPSSSDEKRIERKRKVALHPPRHHSPAVHQAATTFDKDSDAEDDDGWMKLEADARKRQRKETLDSTRKFKHTRAFQSDHSRLQFTHAVHVASRKHNCVPAMGAPDDDVAIELQYPSRCPREKFELVKGKDKIDAVKTIVDVVEQISEYYLTPEEATPFTCPSKGIYRRLKRASAINVQDYMGFKTALSEYNEMMSMLVEDGTIEKNLDQHRQIPRGLVKFILDQVYDRIVAPKVDILNKYVNGTDNIYGELLHPFISKLLVDHIKMTSDQVFVDLGSGVGNVVMQAALEIGCESWGCEMMENACNFADAQQKEFEARCMLWGIQPGKVHLERGDFRKSTRTLEVLKRADVVLVNNKVFTPGLNDALVNMFLDLKSGCKVISLKSFVSDSKSGENSVGKSILEVEEFAYPEEGYVSWTHSGGEYYVSTRK